MRRLLTAAGCALALSAADLQGQIRFGAQASYGDDFDLGIGVRLTSSLQSVFPRTPLAFHGSFDYFFPDDEGTGADISYWEINPNLVYMIPVRASSSIAPYAGGGLNIAHLSVDVPGFGSGDQTELGLNLLGGVQFGGSSRLRPFAEVRVELSGGEQFVLTGGVLF
jgi:opacity protein-like surface antigen